MTVSTLRERYLGDTVSTASPAQLVTMLYDRLLLDLDRAHAALADVPVSGATAVEAGRQLRHAQDIVLELRGSLDLSAWAGAAGLAELYDYMLRELMLAQLRSEASRVADVRALVEPLRETWHVAAAVGPLIPAPRASGE